MRTLKLKPTPPVTKRPPRLFDGSQRFRWGLLIGVTTVITLLLYPKLVVTQHEYSLGDIAERDIKAPKEFFIENEEATALNRRKTRESVLTVYDYNPSLLDDLTKRVEKAFVEVHTLFRKAALNQASAAPAEKPIKTVDGIESPGAVLNDLVWEKKAEFEETIGIKVSEGAYKLLVQHQFSEDIAHHINRLIEKILQSGVVTNKTILLHEMDKGILLKEVGSNAERIVKDLNQFYGLDQAKTLVRVIGQPLLKGSAYSLRNLIIDFAQRLLQPNITLNRSETEERKQKAAADIKPTLYKIKAGEMLLREGERVTEVQLLKLRAIQDQIKKEDLIANSIGAALIIAALLLSTYVLYWAPNHSTDIGHNKNLLFVSVLLIAFLLMAEISASLTDALVPRVPNAIAGSSIIFGTPLAAGTMLICLFMGLQLALPFALILAVCAAAVFGNSFEFFLYFLISGTMAAYWTRDCRERKVLIKAGLKLALLNMLLAVIINVYDSQLFGTRLLWDGAFAFLGGVGAGIITTGLAPMIEIGFNYTTDIKLLELSNLDQPILRQLLINAPGTYHHSVIVGAMVEAAAAEIGANPLLAKVCGYYHDIGKMKKPLYFIENQTEGKNRHDKLAPSMSSLILQAHIKDGVEIAKKNKLGQAIIDTIQQHHGSSLITFFYEKAKQQKGVDAVKIDDFRYPGPKPQTKEIALVMLADVVEAASRTLNNPIPSRIQGMVQNLINKIFSDGQLDNCELTLKDLHNIAKSFNKILNAIYHHRIDYPEKASAAGEKGKNGSSDRQSPKSIQDLTNEASTKSPSHLKRLGQS